MSKKKWIILIIAVLVGLSLFLYSCKKTDQHPEQERIVVKKGTVKEKIVAVGSIVPKHTISIKSNVSGIVGKLFHEDGDYVKQDEILLQVTPSPTPEHIAEAHASVQEQLAVLKQTESHKKRLYKLLKMSLETPDNYAVAEKDVSTARARLDVANQKLSLIQKGETTIAGKNIRTMITSPMSGYILQRNVDVGDPVVPLTEMQEGTVLLVVANMKDLIFKGTVNEIDVAKITPGMKAEISIAALPDVKIKGTLRKVDLQSNSSNQNAASSSPFNVGFDIELNDLQVPKNIKLRAGYSATAEIIVKTANDTVVIPERVLNFKDKKVFVKVIDKNNKDIKPQEIKLGISDGINIQVINGLDEGQTIINDVV